MKLPIVRIDPALPLPAYQTEGSVAFDLYARISTNVAPWKPTVIPANLIIKVPSGYMLMLASRSSTPLKKSLMIANSVGIIDQDYHGDSDEIGVQVINFSQKNVIVERGERIAQGLIVPIVKVEAFVEVPSIASSSRGGFRSTG